MKVLFISNDPTIFVATSPARARMRAYAVAIGELHIVSPASRGAVYKQEGGLFLHPIHAWKIFRVRALTKQARMVIFEHQIEIVSAQDPFEQGLTALRAISGTSAKLHIQVHTDFLSPWFMKGSMRMTFLNMYRCKIADTVLPSAAGIRVVSERVKTSLVARYGSRISEPSVIPVMIDSTLQGPVPLPEHHFNFTLIAVGRLEPEKRIEDILNALKLIILSYPMVGLFIAGEGSERKKLEKMACDFGLSGNVIFLGERPDARSLMRSAHVFIQASAYEGYGRTLIEAALAGIPIITTDVGIVGDVFKNGKEVLAVPVADPMALARAIVEIIEKNSLRQALPINAEFAARAHLATVGDLPSRLYEDFVKL
jgi:glycosyltransferase involved in cell wall biosynthesis